MKDWLVAFLCVCVLGGFLVWPLVDPHCLDGPPGPTRRELESNWGVPLRVLSPGQEKSYGYYEFYPALPPLTGEAYVYSGGLARIYLIYLDRSGRVTGVYHGGT